MSHERDGARTIRVTDRHGDSATFDVDVVHGARMYVTIEGTCVVLNPDDLRALLEHMRNRLIQ